MCFITERRERAHQSGHPAPSGAVPVGVAPSADVVVASHPLADYSLSAIPQTVAPAAAGRGPVALDLLTSAAMNLPLSPFQSFPSEPHNVSSVPSGVFATASYSSIIPPHASSGTSSSSSLSESSTDDRDGASLSGHAMDDVSEMVHDRGGSADSCVVESSSPTHPDCNSHSVNEVHHRRSVSLSSEPSPRTGPSSSPQPPPALSSSPSLPPALLSSLSLPLHVLIAVAPSVPHATEASSDVYATPASSTVISSKSSFSQSSAETRSSNHS